MVGIGVGVSSVVVVSILVPAVLAVVVATAFVLGKKECFQGVWETKTITDAKTSEG